MNRKRRRQPEPTKEPEETETPEPTNIGTDGRSKALRGNRKPDKDSTENITGIGDKDQDMLTKTAESESGLWRFQADVRCSIDAFRLNREYGRRENECSGEP